MTRRPVSNRQQAVSYDSCGRIPNSSNARRMISSKILSKIKVMSFYEMRETPTVQKVRQSNSPTHLRWP